MKRISKFIKTPLGSILMLAAFIGIVALLVRGNRNRSQPPAMSQASKASSPMEHHTITRGGRELIVPKPTSVRPESPRSGRTANTVVEPNAEPLSRPRAARAGLTTAKSPAPTRPATPGPLPISLLAPADNAFGALSHNYAPYGRLIPCQTIITLESSRIDTPIIGIVTEDVWHDGRLIIPAGAEVHGRAANDHARERIAASGQWVVVWRDRSTDNGAELVLNGIALDRQRDDTTGEYGLRDGSAGLVGDILKTDDWQEIKLFASTFLAGMAGGLQQMRDQTTIFGDVAQVPEVSAKNAALQGTADVLNAYAARIQQIIAQDGYYVRVPAGKQFYLYVTQTLDQSKATRGNLRADVWKQNNQPQINTDERR